MAFISLTHDSILASTGGRAGVKEPGLLESAERKPVESVGGEDAYPTLFWKVAAIGYSIAAGHVFSDANKRTATEVMQACLAWNGHYPSDLPPVAVETVILLVGAGQLKVEGLRLALIHLYGLDVFDERL